MLLTREAFLSKTQLRIEKVNLPRSEDYVFVRGLTGAERDEFENANLIRERDKKRGTLSFDVRMENVRSTLVVKGLCTEQGLRLLSDEDVDEVSKLPADVVSHLYSVIAALSGITDEDVQDLIKN
jgi:hypothetical protein